VQPALPPRHQGVERAEAAIASVHNLRGRFDSAKGLAAMLLAAIVSALLVVADQLLETWADGHLLAAWVAMWALGFVAIALLAGTVRRFSAKVVAALDGWAARTAQARADERLWAIALKDARLMAELQSALARDDAKAVLPPVVVSRARAHQTALAGGAPARSQP
jgi:hypothetical protein